MKLTLELVPSTCWWSNLRDLLAVSDWDRVRRIVYRSAGYRCEICGGQGPRHPVECHEVWAYDESDGVHIQRLVRMIALCPTCHAAKHWGLTRLRSLDAPRGDGKDAAQVSEHVKRVNGWSDNEFEAHAAEAFREHAVRSQHDWELDLTALKDYGIDMGMIPAAERQALRDRKRES